MISNKLLALYHTALQMEALLPTSNRTYRAMYATLEHDMNLALDGVALRMIDKFNMPHLDSLPNEGPDPTPENTHNTEDDHDPYR